MSNYRRSLAKGGSYFFTKVSFKRRKILCDEPIRQAMRDAVRKVRQAYPFEIEAWVTLPDHIHAMWTLPSDDADFGKRWGLIKCYVSRQCLEYAAPVDMLSLSNIKRDEMGLWQRRFWEHQIQNEADFAKHMDYMHFNPVGHGLVERVMDWPYSTFHRCVNKGIYPMDWAVSMSVEGGVGE
ncbi:MAG: transposase [Agitococcus sp.]|nr:transposase [Agitococcus sp.]